MRIQCSDCGIVFNVPDGRLPAGKSVRIACPKCRTPLTVEGAIREEPNRTVSDGFRNADPAVEEMPEQSLGRLDLVEDDAAAALMCLNDSNLATRLEAVLGQLGYFVRAVESAEVAKQWWAQNQYAIVLMDDGDREDQYDLLPLVAYARSLPMNLRRGNLVCLLSTVLPTMDGLSAFRIGVDLIINEADLDRAGRLLKRAISEHEATYSLYNEISERRGLS